MNARRVVALGLILPTLLAASPRRPHATPTHLSTPPPPFVVSAPSVAAPALVLLRYAEALTRVSSPPALIFDYTVEQAGLHDIEQKHRIYRGKAIERDEMTEIDGRKLLAPSVRVMSGRTDRYDILAVAPRPERYALAFVRSQRNDGHFDYVFRAVSRTPGSFVVDRVTIDGQTFLPSVVTFHTAGGAAQASGQLSYTRFDGHWLIREASVKAAVGNNQVREHLLWEEYQFPTSLPASTFTPPRTGQSALAVTRAVPMFTAPSLPPSSR
jgi:hypothetical protein